MTARLGPPKRPQKWSSVKNYSSLRSDKKVMLEEKKMDGELFVEKSITQELEEVKNVKNIAKHPYFEYDGVVTQVTGPIKALYGCKTCEWRGKAMCPHGIRLKGSNTSHTNNVCSTRMNYLKTFYRGKDKRPSFDEWQHDYNQGLAQLQMNKEYTKLQALEEKLEAASLKTEDDREEAKLLLALQSKIRRDWFELSRLILEMSNKTITRDKPRKVEVSHKALDPLAIGESLKRANAEILEAEFDEVDEDG